MADQAPPDVATYRVLLGDAQEQLHTLTDASINLCVTSPPYSDLISYDGAPLPTAPVYVAWLLPIIGEVARVLMPGGVLALNLNGQGAWTFPEEVIVWIPQETGLILHERVAWVKTNAIPVGRRESHLIPEWEPIWVFRKGSSLAYFGRDDIRRPYSEATGRRAARGNVHRSRHGNHRTQSHPYVRQDKPEFINPLGRDGSNVLVAAPEQSPKYPHPARFPEAIPEFFIAAYCPPGGTVLDPFVGSGTTCATAMRLRRHSIGIERNRAYEWMIHDRCRQPRFVFAE